MKMRTVPAGLLAAWWVVAAASGCGNDAADVADAPDARPDGFNRQALLERVTADLLVPTYAAFSSRAVALAAAVDGWCAALDDATRASAQQAWRDAIDVWQVADSLLVGPAAMDSRALRDRIYAWPLASTCGVDLDVVAHHQDPGAFD